MFLKTFKGGKLREGERYSRVDQNNKSRVSSLLFFKIALKHIFMDIKLILI